MRIHVSDKERKNTTYKKIKASLEHVDLNTVQEIVFEIDDIEGTITADRIEQVYRCLSSMIIQLYETQVMHRDVEKYARIIMPRVVLDLENIIDKIEC